MELLSGEAGPFITTLFHLLFADMMAWFDFNMLPRRGSNIEDMINEDARIVNKHSDAMNER